MARTVAERALSAPLSWERGRAWAAHEEAAHARNVGHRQASPQQAAHAPLGYPTPTQPRPMASLAGLQLSFEWGWGTPLFTVPLCDLQKPGRLHPGGDKAPAGLQQAR